MLPTIGGNQFLFSNGTREIGFKTLGVSFPYVRLNKANKQKPVPVWE